MTSEYSGFIRSWWLTHSHFHQYFFFTLHGHRLVLFKFIKNLTKFSMKKLSNFSLDKTDYMTRMIHEKMYRVSGVIHRLWQSVARYKTTNYTLMIPLCSPPQYSTTDTHHTIIAEQRGSIRISLQVLTIQCLTSCVLSLRVCSLYWARGIFTSLSLLSCWRYACYCCVNDKCIRSISNISIFKYCLQSSKTLVVHVQDVTWHFRAFLS